MTGIKKKLTMLRSLKTGSKQVSNIGQIICQGQKMEILTDHFFMFHFHV